MRTFLVDSFRLCEGRPHDVDHKHLDGLPLGVQVLVQRPHTLLWINGMCCQGRTGCLMAAGPHKEYVIMMAHSLTQVV